MGVSNPSMRARLSLPDTSTSIRALVSHEHLSLSLPLKCPTTTYPEPHARSQGCSSVSVGRAYVRHRGPWNHACALLVARMLDVGGCYLLAVEHDGQAWLASQRQIDSTHSQFPNGTLTIQDLRSRRGSTLKVVVEWQHDGCHVKLVGELNDAEGKGTFACWQRWRASS